MKMKLTRGLVATVFLLSLAGGASAHSAPRFTRDRAGDLVQVDGHEIITWFCVLDSKVWALADLPQVDGCAYARKASV